MMDQAQMSFVVQSLREITAGQIWDDVRLEPHYDFLEKAFSYAHETNDNEFFVVIHGIVSRSVGAYVPPSSRMFMARTRQLLRDYGHPVEREVRILERDIHFRDYCERLEESNRMLEGIPAQEDADTPADEAEVDANTPADEAEGDANEAAADEAADTGDGGDDK